MIWGRCCGSLYKLHLCVSPICVSSHNHTHSEQYSEFWALLRNTLVIYQIWSFTSYIWAFLRFLLLILNIIQNSEHFSEILWSFTRSGHLPATSDHLSDFLTTTLEWECFLLLSWPRLLVMLPASVWCHNGSKIRADRYHSTDFVRPSGILLPSIFIQLISISTHLTLYACRTGMAVLWA